MAQFMVQVAYSQEAWASLVKGPQDRIGVVSAAVEKLDDVGDPPPWTMPLSRAMELATRTTTTPEVTQRRRRQRGADGGESQTAQQAAARRVFAILLHRSGSA